jgi:hypothetical protein
MKRKQSTPEFTTDAGGQRLVRVSLANTDQRAMLYAEDYQRLMDAGFSSCWAVTSTGGRFQYVLANARNPQDGKRSITIARLVAKAGKGQRVTYVDGDRLNLRGENLAIVKGGGNAAAPAHAIRPRKDATQFPSMVLTTEQEAVVSRETYSVPMQPSEHPKYHGPAYVHRTVDTAARGQRVHGQMAARASSESAR